MNNYQQKIENKIERLKELEEKARRESISRSRAAKSISDFIPMGQPILVGHHSEKRHRRDLERIDNNIRKSIECDNKAQYYAEKIARLENPETINLANPDAKELHNELATSNESLLKEMKRLNKEWRKLSKLSFEERLGEFFKLEMSKELRQCAVSNLKISWIDTPFPSFTLTSLRNKIKRHKEKADFLDSRESMQGFETCGVKVAFEEGYIKCFFPDKPSEEFRTKLKCRPLSLKWSSYSKAWVRKQTESVNEYFLKTLRELIEAHYG